MGAGFDDGEHAGVAEGFTIGDVEVFEFGDARGLGKDLEGGICEFVEFFEVEVCEMGSGF